MAFIKFIILLFIVNYVASEEVTYRSCKDYKGNCVVHAVRIEPCPEAAEDKPCQLKRGKNSIIEFDFTPDFDATTAEARVYWASEIDLPLIGQDPDACKATTCPIVKDKKETFKINLPIAKKFPVSQYDIKWRLTGNEGGECCFITRIQLLK